MPHKPIPKQKARAKLVEQALTMVYGSLQTHLAPTYEKHHDTPAFHKRCVREYAELMVVITKLY